MTALRHHSSARMYARSLSLRVRVPAGPAATRGPYCAALFLFSRFHISVLQQSATRRTEVRWSLPPGYLRLWACSSVQTCKIVATETVPHTGSRWDKWTKTGSSDTRWSSGQPRALRGVQGAETSPRSGPPTANEKKGFSIRNFTAKNLLKNTRDQ